MGCVCRCRRPIRCCRPVVRAIRGLTVAFLLELQKDLVLGLEGAPVAFSQPIVEPCENQKQLWPGAHGLVPFMQLHPQPSGLE